MNRPGNPKIQVSVSDPKLRDKLQIDLQGSLDAIYWYIRFNIPLDETTVNQKNMEVTDTEGYIMRTDISYKSENNCIVISPLDSYEEERYYLLKVSKKVRSAKGQNLKTVISILFKLYRGEISEYKILRQDIPVPPSRPRPKNYDDMQKARVPNFLDNYVENLPKRAKMQQESVFINPFLGILGFIIVAAGFMSDSLPAIVTGMIFCLLGAVHIYMQWQNKIFRAKMYYNKGARHFNQMQYTQAKAAFNKALKINPKNELAKYALGRIEIYK